MFYQPCLHGVVEKVGECSNDNIFMLMKNSKITSYVNEKFQRKYMLCGIYRKNSLVKPTIQTSNIFNLPSDMIHYYM